MRSEPNARVWDNPLSEKLGNEKMRKEGESREKNGHTVKRIDVPKAQVGRLAMEKREIVKPRNKI